MNLYESTKPVMPSGKCKMNTKISSRIITLPGRISFGMCLAILSFLSLSASAVTYYVDFSSGSDTNNGTAASTPWQHCPGDTNATGIVLTNKFAPGDTIFFKGGVQYVGQINLKWSGSSGSPITYDGNSAGTFGTGQAVLNGQNSTTQADGIYASARTNINIRGFEIENIGGHTNITWTCTNVPSSVNNYGIYLSTCTNITMNNCYIHDIGDSTNAAGMTGGLINGTGIDVYGSGAGIVITNCSFAHDRIGIKLDVTAHAMTNISILGCTVSNHVAWGVALVVDGNNSTLNGITIDGLVIHDDYQYASVTWLGCPGTNPHCDGVFCYIGNTPQYTNQTLGTIASPIVIRNSYFYNNTDPSTNNGGTARIYLEYWGGVFEIYNNVFVNTIDQGYGSIAISSSRPPTTCPAAQFYICNNTFYDTNRPMIYLAQMTNAGVITVENNVFCNAATVSGDVPIISDAASLAVVTLSADYNLYYSPKIASVAKLGSAYDTFAQLQAAGFEAHGQNANPAWLNTSYAPGAASSLNDLHLTAPSPATGTGTNLSWMFVTDREGRPRPATGNWDLGAYQFRAPLEPPTNLRVLP